jgi:carbamate kinase
VAKRIPLALIAVGGNALITDLDHMSNQDQSIAAEGASRHIAGIIENGWNVVIIHGNGPQVGFNLQRSDISLGEVPPVSIDYADADTQGTMGFMFQRALYNEFHRRSIDRKAIAIISQVLVDHADPAFSTPVKPIGSYMDETSAKYNAKAHGWVVKEEPGRGWRRVVASPQPEEIVEIEAIRSLIANDFIVIACGGGGIPVIADTDGVLRSVEAVIDKDLTGGLLARKLDAEMLVITTNVDRVALNFDQPDRKWLSSMTVSEAKTYFREGHFPEGSMGPKICSLIKFVESGRGHGLVTNIPNLSRAFDGLAGTHILPDSGTGAGTNSNRDQRLQ